jgi:hypothetical protein
MYYVTVGPNVPLWPTLTVLKKGEGNKKNLVPYTGIIQDYCAPSPPAAALLTASQTFIYSIRPELAQGSCVSLADHWSDGFVTVPLGKTRLYWHFKD